MQKLDFNIPGLELKVKLSSAEFDRPEKMAEFETVINSLIKELVNDQFKLISKITDKNNFSISISRVPNKEIKTYQINVDIGLFKFIYDGLYVILSNNNVFHGLGKSIGQFVIPTLEVPDWNSLDLAMANNDEVYFNTERYNLHNFLYHLCLSFIIRHEIRHIANGHIDFLAERTDLLFDENSKNGLSPLDSQTLEMDVDSCIFAGMIDGLMKHPHQRALMPDELCDDKGIFMSLLFSLEFLLYCMPSKKISGISEIENHSHPNAYLKYFFSVTTGLALISDDYPGLEQLFVDVHKENFWGFLHEVSGKGLINIDPIIQDFEWTMSEEGLGYADRIWDNWNNWISKLEPFAYLKLAPAN
jgi:hypothetical protein